MHCNNLANETPKADKHINFDAIKKEALVAAEIDQTARENILEVQRLIPFLCFNTILIRSKNTTRKYGRLQDSFAAISIASTLFS